jgi:putative ABC transport system ATP-binding protein
MPAENTVILQTEHLTRRVKETTLVQDISIEVYRGEVLALVGPSGSGKTSFLRLLNRLDEPTHGTVLLNGQDYRALPPQELRRRVGMMMQTPYLFPGTVADNIAFGPAQRGERLPIGHIAALLQEVGLEGYLERDVANLSGGEAQRVSLVRTVANDPQVLLCDEPTSALDDAAERDVETLISSIVQQHGLTCIIITHDRDQAKRIANRIMELDGGQLVRMSTVT